MLGAALGKRLSRGHWRSRRTEADAIQEQKPSPPAFTGRVENENAPAGPM